MESQRSENEVSNDTIRTVAISGGTHGNELVGVYLVREWMKNPELVKRNSFTTHLLISNPAAVEKCVRYVDIDLNRQFIPVNLESEKEVDQPYEIKRAKEIESKFGGSPNSKRVDFWLDLHNTTSNSGLLLFVPRKFDSFTLRVAAALQLKHGDCIKVASLPAVYENKSFTGKRSRSGGIADTGVHGFGLEVGPLAHGTLSASLYKQTKSIVYCILDILEALNKGWKPERDVIEVYEPFKRVDYPRDENGEISAMLHPEVDGKDWKALNAGDPLFITFEGKALPYMGPEMAYPILINEASYMEKGTALILTKKTKVVISQVEMQPNETSSNTDVFT